METTGNENAEIQEEGLQSRDTATITEEKNKNPVFRVKVAHSNETMLCVSDGQESFHCGDYVVIPTKYGKDLGRVQGCMKQTAQETSEEIFTISRPANDEDLSRYENHQKNSEKAFAICKEKIEQHNLEMKLVSAHYLLEEPKILFFFTAENRVDFRELVKDLVSVFKMRIELRQIGVRDESRVIGGIGICGRYLCCHSVSDKLNPVSIKMAKEQNMSLNSLKISGPCGRLLCCLGYEYDFYQSEKEKLPHPGTRFTIHNEEYVVTEVNILAGQIRVSNSSGRTLLLGLDDFSLHKQTKRWIINQNKLDILNGS
ncbi:MAG: regulatory iron-sulfur-containing complex subunit RicT [Spirochaetia bacterium]